MKMLNIAPFAHTILVIFYYLLEGTPYNYCRAIPENLSKTVILTKYALASLIWVSKPLTIAFCDQQKPSTTMKTDSTV